MHNLSGGFPVEAALPDLFRALNDHGRAILTASPGSGKTTRVPLALLGLLPAPQGEANAPAPLPGKILVLEPRRLAARAAARYMARLLGESVGQRVGFRVRLESRVSQQTRVELLTEGMFTRRLLADPELSGVSCVIFDEFHERGLQADLGLALCLESRAILRPDLRLLIMSATLDAGELSRFLDQCPVIEAGGRNWPVAVRHASGQSALGPAAAPAEVAAKSALAVRRALGEEKGSILVFLPGRAEIARTAELLHNLPEDTDLFPLYGDLPPDRQDAAIAPPPPGRRKVVLATDLAQTSLTIEGVRLVIDAGLARSPRFEAATGLSRLVTTRLARDAAEQRAGRAGRLEPGLCIRLWPEGEHLAPRTRPEILDADLTPLLLEALAWGSHPDALPWLTPPPQPALQNAARTLLALGAVETLAAGPGAGKGSSLEPGPDFIGPDFIGDEAARAAPDAFPDVKKGLRLTPRGRRLARLPLHPRLAAMVLRAAELDRDLSSLAACLAALVSERDPLRAPPRNTDGPHAGADAGKSADIRLRLPLLQRPENRKLRDVAEQIHRLSGLKGPFRPPAPEEEDFCGLLLSLAWPERLARQRARGSFLLASGQGAELPGHDPLAAEPWLATASLGNGVNRRIYLAAPVRPDDLPHLHGPLCRLEEDLYWDSRNEALVRRGVRRLGALILEEKALPPSRKEDGHGSEADGRIKKILLQAVLSCGLGCLPWTDELRQLQARVALLRRLEPGAGPHPWPDLDDEALAAALEEGIRDDPEAAWLSPWLAGVSRRSQFAGIDLGAALRALLPWPLRQRLEEQAPARLPLASGSSAQVDYLPALRGEAPVLAVKLQEMFGQSDGPRLAGGRVAVMLHLLSPAGRPLQVTGDLRHFWANAYKQVRAEMRGRYPKHPWPEDPLSARPTGRTKKRLQAEK